ncbi:MAG: LON peptidase substrate-binding domain-containing protein [Bacteroidota bacterium]
MSKILPLFPLQLVAFPEEDLNLHIFEPRYRELIKDCKEEGITFGIPPYIDRRVMEYGTELELVEIVKQYDDGKLDVRTRGVGVFQMEEFYSRAPEKLYAGAKMKRVPYDTESDIVTSTRIVERIEELFELMKINKPIPDPADLRTFKMGHHVGLSTEQEYELLTIHNEMDRQDFMLDHLNQLIPMVREMERLRERVQMNGHFKDVIPPKV